MRMLPLALLAVALAVPAGAVADRGSTGRHSTTTVAKSKATVKAEKPRLKARRHHPARTTIVVRKAVVDEREVKGPIVSLSPLTVGSLTCTVPVGTSLAGFRIGDVAEITCDLVQGHFVLRKIHAEDDLVEDRDDEREVKGRIVSLSPLTVGTLTCALPAGVSLARFQLGEFVEITCDLVDGQWVLRKLEPEDDDDDVSHSGPGRGDDDTGHQSGGDHDNSGPGGGDHGGDSGSGSGGGHGDD